MHNPIYVRNFKLYELVSPEVMELLGTNAWDLFNKPFIMDVDKLVTNLKDELGCESAIVNDWKWDGGYTQSGFREHKSKVGAPSSQHKKGNALDLKFKGVTIEEAYDYLVENQNDYPCITRVESLEYTPTWLHLDGKDVGLGELYVFNP